MPLGALYAMSSGDNACMICNSCSSSVRNQSLCFCCSAIASFYSVLSIYLSTFLSEKGKPVFPKYIQALLILRT